MKHSLSLVALACAAALAGCTTVGPDYVRPETVYPVAWSESNGSATTQANARWLRTWWRGFNDGQLDSLVAQAMANNQDLAIARQRLIEALAIRDQAASRAGPTVGIGGKAEAGRASRRIDGLPGGQSRTFGTSLDAAWEPDVFGGTRRAIEAADAHADAVEEEGRAVRIGLLAELASDYAQLRAAQQRMVIAQDNVANLAASQQLAERAFQHGLGTDFEVAQARAEREAAQARLPLLSAEIARMSHAIGVLAGGFPEDLKAVLVQPGPVLAVPADLPATLPSDVMRNRPDIRAAERRLAASTAQIGVATAQLFPRFSIPLSLGTTASLLHNLFSGASVAWSLAANAGHTLYDGGQRRAGVVAANAVAEADRQAYERSVRLAFRDVEDALVGLHTERERQVSLRAGSIDSQRALDRATRLYRHGLSGYLKVLVAQRTAYEAQDTLARSRLAEVQETIALYKALGAGWQGPMAGAD